MNKNWEVRVSELKRTIRLLLDSPLGIIGIFIIFILFLCVLFAPIIATNDPYDFETSDRLKPPDKYHWFGTDASGRDIYSRVIYGARYSLVAGIVVVSIAFSLGTTIGFIGGYPGGKKGELAMRITDMFLAFPTLLLAIALASTLGPSFINAILAISIVYWPRYARLAYGQALSLKENNYVKFAELLGENNYKIRFSHILPNALPALIVQATLDFGDCTLTFASLSFLGLGAQPPTPTWGTMIASSQDYMMVAWWMALFPGLAILVVVLGFNFLGDALRDSLDPQLKRLKAFKSLRYTWLGRFEEFFIHLKKKKG